MSAKKRFYVICPFFYQAEDGIRDVAVTGVQTCALPIWARAYFDLKDDAHGCALIVEALDGTRSDVEFRNQVSFYAPRCSATLTSAPAASPEIGRASCRERV